MVSRHFRTYRDGEDGAKAEERKKEGSWGLRGASANERVYSMKRMEVEDTAEEILHTHAKTGEILALYSSFAPPNQRSLSLHITAI